METIQIHCDCRSSDVNTFFWMARMHQMYEPYFSSLNWNCKLITKGSRNTWLRALAWDLKLLIRGSSDVFMVLSSTLNVVSRSRTILKWLPNPLRAIPYNMQKHLKFQGIVSHFAGNMFSCRKTEANLKTLLFYWACFYIMWNRVHRGLF